MDILKKISRFIKHSWEASLAYLAYGFFALWPLDVASAIGGWIGRTIGPRLAISRRAYKHIHLAFPDMPQAEQDRIVIEMWDNLARNIAETPHLDKLHKKNRISLTGWEHIEEGLDNGKGIIIASGHFANWEIGPLYFWNQGYPITTVYRRPNNPFVDPLLRYTRRVITPNLLAKGDKAAAGIYKTIKRNGIVGLLLDQKMNENATLLPLLGMPAMTGLASAQIALRTQAHFLIGTYVRHHGANYSLHVTPTTLPPADMSEDEAASYLMLQVNQAFDRHITQYPGQWLWLHRRWGKHPRLHTQSPAPDHKDVAVS
jgi:KDO2-lipid IV(A) lauroyltransferase